MNLYLFTLKTAVGLFRSLISRILLIGALSTSLSVFQGLQAKDENELRRDAHSHLPGNALEVLNEQDGAVVFSYQPQEDPDLDPTEGFYPTSYQEELWPDEEDWTPPAPNKENPATAPTTEATPPPASPAKPAQTDSSPRGKPLLPEARVPMEGAIPVSPQGAQPALGVPVPQNREGALNTKEVLHRSNGIVARVNEHIITWNQLNEEMASLIPQLRQSHQDAAGFTAALEAAKTEVLEGMINRQLIVDYFKKKGYRIPKAYVENAFKDHLLEHFGNDRAKFLQVLGQQGRTRLQFLDELEKDLILNAMNQHIRASVAGISPEKMERYYSEHRLRFFQPRRVYLQQIMLKPLTGESPQIMAQTAQSILRKLEKGEDFSQLAQKYSQDPSSEKGGHCGWVTEKDLLPELSQVAFQLQKGQCSAPIPQGDKIFILMATDAHPDRIQPLEEVREFIEAAVVKEESMVTYKRWLDTLRKEAFVTRHLDQ